ncbi:MAG: hypothetical protein Q8O34_00865 [Rhodocyclaceae bacterium]|nr:hypothetical protein [Rhodocyclaceae bacterium]
MPLYAWLRLWALLRLSTDGGPCDPEVLRIEAVAGRLRLSAGNAANDMAAALLILVLFWWLACAKYRAKLAESSAVSCKMPVAQLHPAILREPACLQLFPLFWGSVMSCAKTITSPQCRVARYLAQ